MQMNDTYHNWQWQEQTSIEGDERFVENDRVHIC